MHIEKTLDTAGIAGAAGVEMYDASIEGTSVKAVLGSLRDVLKKNEAAVDAEEQKLVTGIKVLRGIAWEQWKPQKVTDQSRKWQDTGEPISMLVVKRPAIADLPDRVLRDRGELEKRGILGEDPRG